jgi:hypothetical protein
MFRDEEDYIHGFNCIAVAALKTDSQILADAELSTHEHIVVRSARVLEMTRAVRYSYSRYFNKKYHRKGRLGDEFWFYTPLEGVRRVTAAVSYVLRQGLHHGLSATPFEYPHCSVNVIFQKQLGKHPYKELPPDRSRYVFLPHRFKNIPDNYRMTPSGLIFREDVIDTEYVEALYVTPRNFLFCMNRLSDERWLHEQAADDDSADFVSLEMIEKGVSGSCSVRDMLVNERGRVDLGLMTDDELCHLIDNQLTAKNDGTGGNTTIYDLSILERRFLAEMIFDEYGSRRYNEASQPGGMRLQNKRVDRVQLVRCLVLGSED